MNGRIPRATRAPIKISSNNIKVHEEVDINQIVKVVETMAATSVIIIVKSLSMMIMAMRKRTIKTNTIKSRTITMMSMMQSKITMNPMTI